MAAKYGSIWAVDIGTNSLKALHLSDATGEVEVIGFDHIQHGKILTGSGVDAGERDELIALSLRQFVQQNVIGKDEVIVSVPSHNSFARFVNLPPVEAKRIPEIVKYEAAQQIPFDIQDVRWDWQLMGESGGQNRVGIFAIKNDVVTSALEHFARENILVSAVQMAPMALYNYILYDRPELARSNSQATVILNIGAENTDLVVCTKSTVWQRCVPMGGNEFTTAIAEAFKLNFEKAEKLKRTAPMSKYARQILQAMKPVFTDLASEIQRSLGFFTSSNPNTRLTRIIALGGGTKMRGLLKYLQQTLQIPIERPDSFKRLVMSSDVSAAKFHENVSDFGVVYGLCLQGLGLGRIESNLLPTNVARQMAWATKAKYFIAAACMLLAVSLLCFARVNLDRANYGKKSDLRRDISTTIDNTQKAIDKLADYKNKGPGFDAMFEKEFAVFKHRDVMPLLHQVIISALPNEKNNPEQKGLYAAFAGGDVEKVTETPRKERKQIFLTNIMIRFVDDIGSAKLGAIRKKRSTSKKAGTGTGGSGISPFGNVSPFGGGASKSKYKKKTFKKPVAKKGKKGVADAAAETEVEEGPGFVISIAGYSPYKDLDELLDPAGVGDDKSKWGFVTRLLNLARIDPNGPFKLYKKTDTRHFKPDDGVIDLEERGKMPEGIGIEKLRFEKEDNRGKRGEKVLIDPMTKEIISKIAELDEDRNEQFNSSGKVRYQINDHWFILDFKLLWKGTQKETSPDDSLRR